MSDILIKGMEMPINCYECCMYQADIYYCSAAERDIDIPSSDEGRCSFCPLVPVPSHGDLIDRDALRAEFQEPPMIRIISWWRWKKQRPVWEEEEE